MPERGQVERLISEVATGDRAAFGRLYDATSGAIYGLLVRMLRDPELAEDVAQEVYLEVWRKASRFDPDRGAGGSWIALIARSRALDRIRARRAYASAKDRAETVVSSADLMGAVATDPAEAASLGERRGLVRAALAEMPLEQRRAVVLAFFGGLSHGEIAEREDLPLGTVKSRIRAGLEKVESRLRPVLGREA